MTDARRACGRYGRCLTAASLLALAGCDGGKIAAAPSEAETASAGWIIAPAGELNEFFECLEAEGIALVDAHRGGPRPGFPENALETLENTLSAIPAILEIDVSTSADGVPYLMHDDTLDRTTTGEGATDAASWAAINSLALVDNDGAPTTFRPTRFADALAWSRARTILAVDFKRTARYEDVLAEITRQQAEDRVILIAYTLAQAEKLHRLAPGMMISLSVSTQSDLNRAIAAGVPSERLIAFTGVEAPDPRLYSALNSQDVEVIFGTLGRGQSIDAEIAASGDDAYYAELAEMGVDLIATDRPLEAQKALNQAGKGAVAGVCGISKSPERRRS